jgi:hypothetical protein
MGQGHSLLGFVVILILYATIGLMAVVGAVVIVRKVLGPRAEQVFYGVFLVMIAAFYLAFVAYFGSPTPWRLEAAAVLAFTALGLLGARLPSALIAGYALHAVWDLLHELQAHGAYSAFGPGELTAIPLAYGVFCAVFDLGVTVYVHGRRAEWAAARRGEALAGV